VYLNADTDSVLELWHLKLLEVRWLSDIFCKVTGMKLSDLMLLCSDC